MINPATIDPEGAETAGEQLVHRLVLQGERDGREGRAMRSEHPAYGGAYWAQARLRLALAGEFVLCVQTGTIRVEGGRMLTGFFLVSGADAHDCEARLTLDERMVAMVRDGARVIDLEGRDVTLYATRLQ